MPWLAAYEKDNSDSKATSVRRAGPAATTWEDPGSMGHVLACRHRVPAVGQPPEWLRKTLNLIMWNCAGADDSSCEHNETVWRENPFLRCPVENRFAISLLVGIYLIVTNIMLVNLLIAMFRYIDLHTVFLIWVNILLDDTHTDIHVRVTRYAWTIQCNTKYTIYCGEQYNLCVCVNFSFTWSVT